MGQIEGEIFSFSLSNKWDSSLFQVSFCIISGSNVK